jgi:glycolate oxidase FAD binding subunit
MVVSHEPADEAALARIVADAFVTRTALAVRGGGTLGPAGRASGAGAVVSTSALAGVTLHEPAELVLTARAGTPLAAVIDALDQKGQMLPFEPPDYRRLLGTDAGTPTVGGVVAANRSGPRRVVAGACRDALIGVRFVNGRGEIVKSGGRVMKNVTGYDLAKLLAGSWGTLGVLTEVTFKLLPKPETEATLLWEGLSDVDAIALMSAALGSPYEVSAAAHCPAMRGEPAKTLLRLENFERSVTYRAAELQKSLKRFGAPALLDAAASRAAWAGIRDVLPLAGREGAIWRVSVAPSKAAAVVRALAAGHRVDHFYDWGGGLVWLAAPETPETPPAIRAAAAAQGGHAMLLRASDDHLAEHGLNARASGPLGDLVDRLRAAFDPAGLLNPGLMYR